MKIKDLIEALKKFDPELEVCTSGFFGIDPINRLKEIEIGLEKSNMIEKEIEITEKYIKRIENEKTLSAAKLVTKVYEFCEAGGYAHIVVADYNIEDDHIESCLESAIKKEYEGLNDNYWSEENRLASIKCMEAFKELTIEERLSALAIANNEPMIPIDDEN